MSDSVAGAIAPREDSPETPAGLSDSAAKLWGDATRDFHFDRGELPLLEAACWAWHRAEQARDVLDKEGLLTASGEMAHPHPAVRIERDALREFRLCWSKLGLVDPGAGK